MVEKDRPMCVHIIIQRHNNQPIATILSKMTSSVAAMQKKFALNQTQIQTTIALKMDFFPIFICHLDD